MKLKYKFSLFLAIIVASITLVGCSDKDSSSYLSDSESKEFKLAKQSDIKSYKYNNNNEFEIIHYENIKDGTSNGINISILVHKETRVMYRMIEKFQGGYGLSSEIMVDSSGNPLLYEGGFKTEK